MGLKSLGEVEMSLKYVVLKGDRKRHAGYITEWDKLMGGLSFSLILREDQPPQRLLPMASNPDRPQLGF